MNNSMRLENAICKAKHRARNGIDLSLEASRLADLNYECPDLEREESWRHFIRAKTHRDGDALGIREIRAVIGELCQVLYQVKEPRLQVDIWVAINMLIIAHNYGVLGTHKAVGLYPRFIQLPAIPKRPDFSVSNGLHNRWAGLEILGGLGGKEPERFEFWSEMSRVRDFNRDDWAKGSVSDDAAATMAALFTKEEADYLAKTKALVGLEAAVQWGATRMASYVCLQTCKSILGDIKARLKAGESVDKSESVLPKRMALIGIKTATSFDLVEPWTKHKVSIYYAGHTVRDPSNLISIPETLTDDELFAMIGVIALVRRQKSQDWRGQNVGAEDLKVEVEDVKMWSSQGSLNNAIATSIGMARPFGWHRK